MGPPADDRGRLIVAAFALAQKRQHGDDDGNLGADTHTGSMWRTRVTRWLPRQHQLGDEIGADLVESSDIASVCYRLGLLSEAVPNRHCECRRQSVDQLRHPIVQFKDRNTTLLARNGMTVLEGHARETFSRQSSYSAQSSRSESDRLAQDFLLKPSACCIILYDRAALDDHVDVATVDDAGFERVQGGRELPCERDGLVESRRHGAIAQLGYTAISSLDGYVEDAAGSFAWAEPDEEVHHLANELDRTVGTILYGRRLYETMVFWEDPDNIEGGPEYIQEYGRIWRASDKIVFSRTLDAVSSARTRIEWEFDPELIRQWKSNSDVDMSVGGAELAGVALRAGLVDDVHLLLAPVIVGGGKRALPDALTQKLELVDVRAFPSGFAYLHYRLKK